MSDAEFFILGCLVGWLGPDLYRFGKLFVTEVKYMIDNWNIK